VAKTPKPSPSKSAARARAQAPAPSRSVTVGLTQFASVPDVAGNRARQLTMIEQAAKDGAQVICTQEMCTTQYFCQSEDHRFFAFAESIPGPTTDAVSKLARKYGVVVVASLFEKRASGLYHNTAAVVDADGALMGVYRKMHIPDDPLFYEKFYFTPGDVTSEGGGSGGFRAWKTRHATIGVLICWDQWFPEGARLTAMQGAEILFYPTAIGWHPSEKREYGVAQHDSWEVAMRAHAIANGCYVCAPNRVGHERILGPDGKPVSSDGLEFWGQSFVAAPNGQVVHRASVDMPEIAIVECDLDRVEFSRTHWPFLRDRRIDAYAGLTRRFGV
jgi:N-carbamoylputrescine amidase